MQGMTIRMISWMLALGLAMTLAGCKPQAEEKKSTADTRATAPAGPVIVMTAASAKDAMADLAKTFLAQTGIQVTVVTAGSNTLATQILADAPASLFLSASAEWAEKVKDKGYVARIQPLLSNDLALIVPTGNPGHVATPADLSGPLVKKIALAGAKVPAGKYAEQALNAEHVFSSLAEQNKIVRGEDVRVALSYVERGEAEAGIVYSTDAIHSTRVQTAYTFDPSKYDRIVYPLELLKSAENQEAAARLFDYLQSPEAEKTFAKYGFVRIK